MAIEETTITIRGVAPLLIKNGNGANPLRPNAKEMKKLTSKRNKTDEDYAELSRAEWFEALYLDEDKEICIPGENIEAMLIGGAKKRKLGTVFKSAVFSVGNWKINHGNGKLTLEQMYESGEYVDRRMAGVAAKRVLRTRPIFRKWSLTFGVTFDAERTNAGDIRAAVMTAGLELGLGDYRPRFGRFVIAE